VEARLAEEAMNIIEPYARLVRIDGVYIEGTGAEYGVEAGISALRWIEECARVSHRSEEAMNGTSWQRFIPAVVRGKGDWSVVEHASASVELLVDRGITHEIVRHRLFSFTQESTRFVNYAKDGHPPAFIEPPGLSDDAPRALNGELSDLSTRQLWRNAVNTSERTYRRLLEWSVTPQIARSAFPNALASKIVMTGNLRSWRWFLIMRTTKEAHPQMKQVTIPLLTEFKRLIPLLYDDIEPEASQKHNLEHLAK
jgi:thymidylate synthase (FAD)